MCELVTVHTRLFTWCCNVYSYNNEKKKGIVKQKTTKCWNDVQLIASIHFVWNSHHSHTFTYAHINTQCVTPYTHLPHYLYANESVKLLCWFMIIAFRTEQHPRNALKINSIAPNQPRDSVVNIHICSLSFWLQISFSPSRN